MSLQIAIVGHIINETIVFPDRTIAPVLGSPSAYSAVIAAVLGTKVGLVTKIGKDFPPTLLVPLGEAQVSLEGLSSDHEHSTANIMTYDENGHKSMAYRTQAPPIYFTDVPEAYHDAPLFFVCPMYYEVPLETVEKLAALPGQVVVDLGGYGGATSATHPNPDERVNNSTIRALARVATVLKASLEDCRHILPADLPPEQLARTFVAWGARVGIVTLGKEGALAVEGENVYRVPSFPTVEVDATGARDAFSAGFLVEFLRTGDVEKSTRFACATASLVIEESGGVRVARMPTRERVERRIQCL